METGNEPETVRGVTIDEGGLRIDLDQPELPQAKPSELSFRVLAEDGSAVTDFEVEHERRMHLIVARRDLTGFQHLHPEMAEDGTWSTQINLPEAGAYRVFADFNHEGESLTLGQDLVVDGDAEYQELPTQETEFVTGSGYAVRVEGQAAQAGQESELAFDVTRNGEPVEVEPYLGADGHLVALREGDLAFLHVHPEEHGDGVGFAATFPTAGRYRLFLQFKHDGAVQTVAFTQEVSR